MSRIFSMPDTSSSSPVLAMGLRDSDARFVEDTPPASDRPRPFAGIAVVGMGCRLPGGVDSPESLWAALSEGRDLISEVPPDRWDVNAHYDADASVPGKIATRHGGFLAGVAAFDAPFFDLSPREAKHMDPQQRLGLETAWEALEDAGLDARSLRGSRAGVFVGSMWAEYDVLASRHPESISPHGATGSDPGMIAARIAYTFGLRGPALSVNTASSSSLVAVHLALQSLQSGECELALAGGANLILTPYNTIKMTKLGTMSPDGRCKAFDHRANGYVRAEGVGFVVLKRLSRATADGDRIYAVVRGSAVNNDGLTEGLTAPSVEAQEAVLREAYARAGVSPAEVDYVEAHGTGTPLGDRVEATALGRVLGAGRAADRALRVGSVKTNLGHAEAAAGVAGLMKTALSLRHGSLPASLHVERPNPEIPLEALGLRLQTELGAWPEVDRPRRAGVSSFGFGGTNCHVVLEEWRGGVEQSAAETGSEPGAAVSPPALPLVLSARDHGALRAQAGRWAAWLTEHREARWADVIHTAAARRTHLGARATVVAAGVAEAVDALRALADGRAHGAVTVGEARERGKVVFVFPGQGSQWPAMGRALLSASRVFAEAVEACDAALRPLTGWSVLSLLRGDAGEAAPSLDRVDAVQPALFAMAVGLSAVFRAWGLDPSAVVGHSQGEVPAAYVAGALSLDDAARVVAVRSALVRRLSGAGAMAAVELPAGEVERRLAPFGGALSVAVVNTSSSTAVSGDAEAVDRLVAQLEAEGIFCRKVNVDYASHSAHVDVVLPELLERLAPIRPGATRIPFYSTVTGGVLEGTALDGAYWCRNLRQPVRLDRALARLLDDGHGVFVEVSAHPVLASPLTAACAEREGVVVGSLHRDDGGLARLLGALGALHVQGQPVDWRAVLAPFGGGLVNLPTYAFQRQRYWFDTDESVALAAASSIAEESWSEKLAGLSPARREERLLEWVRAEIAAVLGLEAPAVPPDVPLRDLGLKSPIAVELGSRLGRRTRRKLPVSFVYNHPTPRAIARALLEGMFSSSKDSPPSTADDRRPPGVPAGVAPPQALETSEMSDDELFQSIDALV
ncbi:type I polyketide synthase [Sorangium cellulosum]